MSSKMYLDNEGNNFKKSSSYIFWKKKIMKCILHVTIADICINRKHNLEK